MTTDRTTKLLLTLIALALFLNALIPLVQPGAVEAQGTGLLGIGDPEAGEWRMHGSATNNATWLYSSRSGKVYYIEPDFNCAGDEGDWGCMGAVPVFAETTFLPQQ